VRAVNEGEAKELEDSICRSCDDARNGGDAAAGATAIVTPAAVSD